MKQGLLIILSGPALTGKSTFLGMLRKHLPAVIIISTDEIRMELYQSYDYKPEREHEVWTLAYQRLEDHLRLGDLVALDATLRTIENRGAIVNRFQKFPIVYFAFEKPDLSLLLERNRQRKWKQFPEDAVKKMHDDYQFPTATEKTYYFKVFDVPFMDFSTTIKESSDWIKRHHE